MEYSPGSAPEIEPMAQALTRHLLWRGRASRLCLAVARGEQHVPAPAGLGAGDGFRRPRGGSGLGGPRLQGRGGHGDQLAAAGHPLDVHPGPARCAARFVSRGGGGPRPRGLRAHRRSLGRHPGLAGVDPVCGRSHRRAPRRRLHRRGDAGIPRLLSGATPGTDRGPQGRGGIRNGTRVRIPGSPGSAAGNHRHGAADRRSRADPALPGPGQPGGRRVVGGCDVAEGGDDRRLSRSGSARPSR